MVHWSREVWGKSLSQLSRGSHLELISFVVLCLYAPSFFSSSHLHLIPFHVFFNQAILFLNMHEGASAWLQGEGRWHGNGWPEDSWNGKRDAIRVVAVVCMHTDKFSLTPFLFHFLNLGGVFFFFTFLCSRYLLPRL
ncbi:hypothetical protein V8C35DRAFT_263793 [Trichoderma chlorosporum]